MCNWTVFVDWSSNTMMVLPCWALMPRLWLWFPTVTVMTVAVIENPWNVVHCWLRWIGSIAICARCSRNFWTHRWWVLFYCAIWLGRWLKVLMVSAIIYLHSCHRCGAILWCKCYGSGSSSRRRMVTVIPIPSFFNSGFVLTRWRPIRWILDDRAGCCHCRVDNCLKFFQYTEIVFFICF